MRFELFAATRYLRGKRRTRFVSLITIISVAGVSVGVIALIVVMSVMTGFDIALRATIIGNRSHLTVYNLHQRPLSDWERTLVEVERLNPEVVAGAPVLQIEALLSNEGLTTGGLILGVDPELETEVTDIATNLTTTGGRHFGRGELPGDKEIVLGYRLAHRIHAQVGDHVSLITAKSTVRAFQGASTGSRIFLRVSGLSQAQMSEFDNLYAWVNLETARMLTGIEGVDAVHFKLNDPFAADKVSARTEDNLPYIAETWYENQEAFFAALEQEKLAMFIILTFIVLVAAFNISSTLIMIVMEKRRDIGILRTLGTSSRSILTLFILQGLLIGLSGTAIGLVLGVLLSYNLNTVAEFIAGLFGVNLWETTIYYFDRIPVAIIPWDVFWVAVAAVTLTLLSTIYPAWSASRVQPVDALRYE